MPVTVEWCYHAYILLKAGDVLMAIDPHDGGSLGLPTCRVDADYILVTHDHFDHNAVEVARGERTKEVLKRFYGSKNLGPFTVTGVKVYHDKASGTLRGEVAAYRVEVEGLSLVHLGDIGHVITSSSHPELSRPDVLFVPVGGTFTVNAAEAWKIVENLRPRIAVPIHYWMPGSHLPIDPLDRFLQVARAGRKPIEGRVLELSPEKLPEKTTIYYFKVQS
ncbi:MBL fold metallo-hydrolase [Aeropyrum pernix]|nr:MBL fold metallo-hydrolase [Aeropyrum pernix]